MELRVRNFVGIKKADVPLKGIVLVSGRNGAGKSSLIEAAACAITQSHMARGQTTKKAAAALLHRGADAGSVSLDYDGGHVRITYPGAEVEQTGRPESLGTAIGIGAAKFMRLKPDDRTREITERFHTTPTAADMTEWFRDNPGADIPAEGVAELFERVTDQGWDVEAKKAAEFGTKIKGRWEEVTTRRWGSNVAKDWHPPGLHPDRDYDHGEAVKAIAAAKQELEQRVRASAVSAADIERLRAQAETATSFEEKLAHLAGKEAELSAEADGIIRQQNASDAPIDTSTMPECPHCGRKVRIVRTVQDYVTLEKGPVKPMTDAELKEARKRQAELDGQLQRKKNELRAVGDARTLAHKGLADAQAAQAELRRVENQPIVDEAAVTEARNRLLSRERTAQSILDWTKAKDLYREFVRHERLIEALSPGGVRRMVLERKLSEINDRLSKLSTVAKFGTVELHLDMEATFDGRPYALLSESEQWRVDLVLAVLLCREEKARMIVVDRLDVLHPQARPGALYLLNGLGIPALVTMTGKDPDSVPDLAKARIGVNRWLDAGVLSN